jgi:hypothetical protein
MYSVYRLATGKVTLRFRSVFCRFLDFKGHEVQRNGPSSISHSGVLDFQFAGGLQCFARLGRM